MCLLCCPYEKKTTIQDAEIKQEQQMHGAGMQVDGE
jgi:hypothetical protein